MDEIFKKFYDLDDILLEIIYHVVTELLYKDLRKENSKNLLLVLI